MQKFVTSFVVCGFLLLIGFAIIVAYHARTAPVFIGAFLMVASMVFGGAMDIRMRSRFR